MIVSVAGVAVLALIVIAGGAREWLRGQDVHPGEMPVYAPSDFRSKNERGDG
jgi:hypothetical protein